MTMRSISNSFTRGELDPALFARDDIDIYTKGARKMRNMIPLWTGAARIAPGLEYVDVIVDRENSDAVVTNEDYINTVDFLFDSANDIVYTLVVRQSNAVSAIDIYYDNTLQATVTGLPYTNAQIKDIYFAASGDRILFLHESVQTRQLVRGASHSSWTFSTFTPGIYPTFDFSTKGLAPSYNALSFTLGAVTGTDVALNSSAAIFTANHVGGILVGFGDYAGVALITAVSSTIAAKVRITTDFMFTTLAGYSVSLQEKMWNSDTTTLPVSQDRGWPSRGAFYLNRLILARTSVLKNIAAVSTAGVYDNFDSSEVDALSAFTVSFNGKGEQSVESIVTDDSLIFLTTGKIFAQSPLVETPLSALNVYFTPQTQGPSAAIEAVTLDNQVLYVSDTQSQVMQAGYLTDNAKYAAAPAGLLANHLFDTINDSATWEPKGITTRLMFATQDDGTMLMYSTLIQQNVAGWSLRNTRGNFIQVVGEGKQASNIVQRQINLGTSTFETTADYAYISNNSMTSFYDVQADLASASGSAVTVFEEQYNYLVLGNDVPFTAMDITLDTNASTDCDLKFEYLDGNGFWDTFTPTDNTSGFTGDGSITWAFTDVANWLPMTVNGVESRFWMRIRRQEETVATVPIIEQLLLNTGNRFFLEKMSFDLYTDSTVDTTSDASGNVTGLTNLAGQQVYAIENGFTTGPYFVESDGSVTIQNLSATVQIGIQYAPLLVPMPLFTPTQEGDNTYTQKYVQDLFIDYVDSLYLKAGIEDVLTDIPNMQLGNYTLGQPVSPQTGIYHIHPRGGWGPRQEITITQSQPGPMTIIGVGYHVEVS